MIVLLGMMRSKVLMSATMLELFKEEAPHYGRQGTPIIPSRHNRQSISYFKRVIALTDPEQGKPATYKRGLSKVTPVLFVVDFGYILLGFLVNSCTQIYHMLALCLTPQYTWKSVCGAKVVQVVGSQSGLIDCYYNLNSSI